MGNNPLEHFPAWINPQLYQPQLGRLPTWNALVLSEALTSMCLFKKNRQLSCL
jgi:hypothetical protein